MADFKGEDLRSSRFESTDLTGAHFHNVDLTGAKIRGALMVDVDIDGVIDGLRVNGVEVAALVEAELNRRDPDRAKLRPSNADGFREAWAVIENVWPSTIERARRLAPELLHERVDGEWSFIETLRHLVFATDAWVNRAILGDPMPYDASYLPHTDMEETLGIPVDHEARPSLDEILVLRADRMASVRKVVASLTDEALEGQTTPLSEPGYPPPRAFPVRRCLQAVLNEEWLHRQYAERDLAVLEA